MAVPLSRADLIAPVASAAQVVGGGARIDYGYVALELFKSPATQNLIMKFNRVLDKYLGLEPKPLPTNVNAEGNQVLPVKMSVSAADVIGAIEAYLNSKPDAMTMGQFKKEFAQNKESIADILKTAGLI